MTSLRLWTVVGALASACSSSTVTTDSSVATEVFVSDAPLDEAVDARGDVVEAAIADVTDASPDALTDASEDAATDAAAPDVATAGWRSHMLLPLPRQEIGVIAMGARIYVVGGFESGVPVANVRVYDASTDAWSEGPALPNARHHVALAAVGEDLYAIGGELGLDFRPDPSCYVLRAGATAWRAIASLPAARGAVVAGAIAGRIYAAGGMGPSGALPAPVLIYDPTTDRWREGAPITTPREHLAGFVYRDRLWTVGGRRVSLTTNTAIVEIYDPASDSWAPGPAMPTARGGLSVALLGDTAYAVGGEQPDRALDVVEALDLNAMTWRAVTPVPTPRHGHGAASALGRMYVVGGANRPIFAPVRVIESYAP